MYRQLYPTEHYPQGHPDLATSLNNLGGLLKSRGEYAAAEPFYRDALAMRRQLYPKEHYPQGHPDLAQSLNNLGGLLQARGESAAAEPLLPRRPGHAPAALPPERYPQGHPHLATSLNNLGVLLQSRGDLAAAEPFYREALAMYRDLIDRLAETAPRPRPSTTPPTSRWPATPTCRSPAGCRPTPPSMTWCGPASRPSAGSPRAATETCSPAATRARWTWAAAAGHPVQAGPPVAVPAGGPEGTRPADPGADRHEGGPGEAHRRAAADVGPRRRAGQRHTGRLADRLPPGAAFIDLLRYEDFDLRPGPARQGGRAETPSYVAFVVARGRPAQRVELGPAAPIERTVGRWRREITARGPALTRRPAAKRSGGWSGAHRAGPAPGDADPLPGTAQTPGRDGAAAGRPEG